MTRDSSIYGISSFQAAPQAQARDPGTQPASSAAQSFGAWPRPGARRACLSARLALPQHLPADDLIPARQGGRATAPRIRSTTGAARRRLTIRRALSAPRAFESCRRSTSPNRRSPLPFAFAVEVDPTPKVKGSGEGVARSGKDVGHAARGTLSRSAVGGA